MRTRSRPRVVTMGHPKPDVRAPYATETSELRSVRGDLMWTGGYGIQAPPLVTHGSQPAPSDSPGTTDQPGVTGRSPRCTAGRR
jgi:hypothetical protein